MNGAEAWNKFLDKMVEARESWEEYREIRLVEGVPEDLDIPSMRHMSSTLHKAPFNVALPRLVDYWRRYGGIEELYAKDSSGSKFDADLGMSTEVKAAITVLDAIPTKTKKEEVKNDGGAREARRIKSRS